MKSQKILWFDVETTGLNSVENGIIQLSGLIEVDHEVVSSFDYKVNIFDSDKINVDALEVSGIKLSDIKTFENPLKVHDDLIKKLSSHCSKYDKYDKFFPAGYNCKFDIDFLSQWFLKCNDKYLGSWINWRFIDPLALVNILSLEGKIRLENHKLVTLCEYLDIEIDAHNAMSDITATRAVYHKLREMAKITY